MSDSENSFCTKCGASATSGAAFCPSCGTPTKSPAEATPQASSRVEWREYSYARRRGDKSAPLVGGLIVMWLGISLYLAQVNSNIGNASWWAYFFVGVGVILIAAGMLRWAQYRYRYPPTGFLIGGAFLLIIGLATVVQASLFGPGVLVAIGVVIIVFGAYSMRSKPAAQSAPTPPAQA